MTNPHSSSAPRGLAERRESYRRSALALGLLVALGAAAAAALGLFSAGGGGRSEIRNAWGDPVSLDGRGVYRHESVSSAAQVRANDLVTLLLALPLLVIAGLAARGGGLRARLGLAGILGYFLYTYGSLSIGLQLNELFLLYVGLFALSLFAFVFAFLSIDIEALEARAASRFPRRSVIAFCCLLALFFLLAWIGGRVLPAQAPGGTKLLEHYHTLFIQALDLGLIASASVLAAFWLLRRDGRGYLLGSVLMVKGAALGLAVTAMAFNMLRAGVEVAAFELIGFPLLSAGAIFLAARTLAAVGEEKKSEGA